MALWRPRIKPGPPQQIRLNPQGRLSRGLWSCVLFENAAAGSSIRDYAAPGRRLFFDGANEQPVATISPWGGSALSFATDTNAGYLGLEAATQAAPNGTSCSFLTRFDGTNGGSRTFEIMPYYDPTVGSNILQVASSNNTLTDASSAVFLTPAVTTFSTWTRLTVTFDGTTAFLYANGVFQSSAALSLLGFAPTRICGNWPWPMADFFFWFNRVLSPGDVAAHFSDPYGTTLLSLRRSIGRVGIQSAAPGAGSVVTTGFVPVVLAAPAPAAGALIATGRAPTASTTVAPSAGALLFTGFAPLSVSVAPSVGSLIVTGLAPDLTGVVPSAFSVEPGAGMLIITGRVPSVPTLAGIPLVQVTPAAAAPDFLARLKAVLPHGWFPDDTPILDGVLSGCAAAWATCYDLLAYVRPQTRIATATGVFLDLMADDYFADRLNRFVNENDPRFSLRIRASLLPHRGTRQGVIDAVTALVGEAPTIFEPANTGDTGAYGGGYAPVWRGMAYNLAGGWGSLALPFQAFVTSARARGGGIAFVNGYGGFAGGWGVGAIEWASPDMSVGSVPDEVIFQTVAESAPAGSIMWTRLGGAATGTWDNFIWDSGTVWQ